jgi:hypothetical protein
VDALKIRLRLGPLDNGEAPRLAAGWGVSSSQVLKDSADAQEELEAESQPAAAKLRAAMLIDQAAVDASLVTDPTKRSAARVKVAMALLDLHGLRKPQAPDADPKPPAPQATVAEQIAAAERAAKGTP